MVFIILKVCALWSLTWSRTWNNVVKFITKRDLPWQRWRSVIIICSHSFTEGISCPPYVFGKLPSLYFGLYAECISTFLERNSTIPSTLNTEATPAQRTCHLIPSVEEWIHRIVTELHLNQGKSRLVINYTEWCYIKRTTDNVLQIVLQASQ